jgi:hypothetical protein
MPLFLDAPNFLYWSALKPCRFQRSIPPGFSLTRRWPGLLVELFRSWRGNTQAIGGLVLRPRNFFLFRDDPSLTVGAPIRAPSVSE